MRRPVQMAILFVLPFIVFCVSVNADARRRCDEMRYRYLKAKKQIKIYSAAYKSLYVDYKNHKASLGRLGNTIYKLEKQLKILKRNYPREPSMWRGKEKRIAWLKRGYKNNKKNLKLTIQELNKYRRIIEKNKAIYRQNYTAWIQYGCKR